MSWLWEMFHSGVQLQLHNQIHTGRSLMRGQTVGDYSATNPTCRCIKLTLERNLMNVMTVGTHLAIEWNPLEDT